MLGSIRLRRVLGVAALTCSTVVGGVTAATPAGATTETVPGCYGVGVIVCNPTVDAVLPYKVTTTQTTVPVCAGTCTDVTVDVPGVQSQPSHVCVTAQDRVGNTTIDTCTPAGTPRLVKCYGATGYYVEDGNGNELLNACLDPSLVPALTTRRCSLYVGTTHVNSYQVYDTNSGQVWVDGCGSVNTTL
jgi:hypothetical protein